MQAKFDVGDLVQVVFVRIVHSRDFDFPRMGLDVYANVLVVFTRWCLRRYGEMIKNRSSARALLQ